MDTYIDQAIDAWLEAKYRLSGSRHTKKAYGRIITRFRAWLEAHGHHDLDLDLWADKTNEPARRRALALFTTEVQRFAEHTDNKARVANRTYDARLIALSSFYEFAINRGFFSDYANPVKKVERPRSQQQYSHSRALDAPSVARAIRAIDRTTPIGRRNYALFAVYFETARRASEVLGLTWGNVEIYGQPKDPAHMQVILTFERCKGGKTARHVLSPAGTRALLECVASSYPDMDLKYLNADRPLWISYSTRHHKRGVTPLSYAGMSQICLQHLGTTQVHQIRHTVARECERAGMPITDIQALLGHSSLVTTTTYLSALTGGENSVIDALDTVFGFV